ncbi:MULTISPECIES: hypothetical protein [unclassified Microcoleus]|uniref:hypothetical protein n=1 Tax=unclassified Microcoleus TaxID=2642155 RepID=UPI00312B7715
MNIQLVDSLIQVIESLTPEESLLFQEKLSARVIQSTPISNKLEGSRFCQYLLG